MVQGGAGAGARTAAAADGGEGGGVVHAGQDAQGRADGGAPLQGVAEGLRVPGGGQRCAGGRAVPAHHARTTGAGAAPLSPSLRFCHRCEPVRYGIPWKQQCRWAMGFSPAMCEGLGLVWCEGCLLPSR